MTYEKPWAKPFDELLGVLSSEWGGDVRGRGSRPETEFYFYPEYAVELDGRAIEIRISDFPAVNWSLTEAEDNTESFRVRVSVKAEHSIHISREGLPEKLKKLVGLEREPQTGARGFDKRYWLRAGSADDEQLLGRAEFREAVQALDPFALISVAPGAVLASRRIGSKEDLSVETAVAFVNGTITLARLTE